MSIGEYFKLRTSSTISKSTISAETPGFFNHQQGVNNNDLQIVNTLNIYKLDFKIFTYNIIFLQI